VDKHIESMAKAGKIPEHIDPADLREAGEYGLIRAIHSFDPNKGNIHAHVANNIRGHIQSAVSNMMEQQGVPRGLHGQAKAYDRSKNVVAGEKGVEEPAVPHVESEKPKV
jgi:DNA-directed RNA polymerase specialized sigma subunit